MTNKKSMILNIYNKSLYKNRKVRIKKKTSKKII